MLHNGPMEDYEQHKSWNNYSRNRVNEHDDEDKVLKERTENGRIAQDLYDPGERNIARVKRKRSLRLSYDPGREPGGEYLVEKDGDDSDEDLQSGYRGDNIVDDSPEVVDDSPDGFGFGEQIPTFRTNTEVLDDIEIGDDSEKENGDVRLIRNQSDLDVSDENKSVSLESFQESEPPDSPKPSSPLRSLEVPIQLPESSERPEIPEYIEPATEHEVEPTEITPEPDAIEFKPELEPKPEPEHEHEHEYVPKLDLEPTPVPALELDLELEPDPEPDPKPEPLSETPLANPLDSAKESTTSSLPPTNFKTTLFKRVRQVSTPRKTPRFTPILDRTLTKTPVIDDLGDARSEHQSRHEDKTPSIYVSAAHNTFFKDSLDADSVSRFQRHDSSDSIRIHYDKHIRREEHKPETKSFNRYEQVNVDTNARTSFKNPVRLPEIKKVETTPEIESYPYVKPVPKQTSVSVNTNPKSIAPVREKMQLDTKQYENHMSIPGPKQSSVSVNTTPKSSSLVPEKMQLDTKQYENHLSILAKKPVLHKVQIKSNTVPTKYAVKTNEKSLHNGYHEKVVNTRLDDSDDIFSESEKRSKLKQAQYITEGLRLVKKKVKETELIMKQTIKLKQDLSNKRSVLKSLNTQRKPDAQKSSLPTKLPRPAKTDTLKHLNVEHHDAYEASESGLEGETQTEITDSTSIRLWNNRTKLLNRNRNRFRSHRPSIDTKSSIPTQSQYSLETMPVPSKPSKSVWNPQPRLHRTNPTRRPPRRLNKMSKRSEKTFFVTPVTTASTNSVERWVVQTIKENTMNRDTLALPKIKRDMGEIGLRAFAKKPKLKVKLPKRKKPDPTNIINKGMYMPLPTKLERQSNHVYTQVGKVKGYESEIPILYSDDDEYYEDQRPNTVNERRRYPDYGKYGIDNGRTNFRDPAHRKVGRTTGALVRLFRNGDPQHKGIPLTINQKFKNFESLLVTLNDKIPTPTGVKYIFKWPECREIKSVKDFQNRCVYIVSSTKNVRRDINYGESRESFWVNKRPSAGKVRSHEVDLFKRPSSPPSVSPKSSPKASPYIVNIIHNLRRDKRDKVLLNPHISQQFEEWLEDIHNRDIPVRALFVNRPPYTQVQSFSHLFRELRSRSTFLACGDELLPLELVKKRQAPSSDSSTESLTEARGRKKPPRQQDMDQIYENGRQESPISASMSRYDMGPTGPRNMPPVPRVPPPQPQPDNRRNTRGSFKAEIDGVMREFWPPSYMEGEPDGSIPGQKLQCQWVYGFRGRDARHNLSVIPSTGELVYYVASIVVLYNKDRDTQRHYNKHNEEISCLTLHPNGFHVATGQLHGKEPEHSSHIRIWDHETLSTYSVIGLGVFYGGIISIAFSHQGTGNLMCALDGSSKHVLSVWRVALDGKNRGEDSNYIIARTSMFENKRKVVRKRKRKVTSTDPVHCACFYPGDENNSILITYGAKHIYFWKIFFDATKKREAKIFRDRNSGIFEEHCPKSINCLAFLSNGDVVSGDSSGNLMVWDRDAGDAFTCKFVVQAHQGPIMSVVALKDGTILSGGGNEIKGWDSTQNFTCASTRSVPVEVGGVRSIVTMKPGGPDGNVYIGTTRSCILEGSMKDKFSVLIQENEGHLISFHERRKTWKQTYQGEGHSESIMGLVPHPYEPTFITAGTDAVVYKWSVITHKVYWRSQIEAPCTSLAVDPNNELVALGTADGTFAVLNAFNGMHIATVQVGTETISCISFSPDGMLLAIGCNDGLITIFNVLDRGHTYVKASVALRGHDSGVAHLDWSKDNNSLQSVSDNKELIFWDLMTMKQNKSPMKTRDIEWATNTCNVSYALVGPWQNLKRGEQIKVVSPSKNQDIVLVGDTVGRLRLYKYPCHRERADFRNVRVYSSEVTAVAFTPDSRMALTCGGNDAALIQWAVEEDFQ